MDESLVAELDVWQPVGLSHPIEDCAVGSVDLRRKLFGRDKTGKKVAAHSAALSKNCAGSEQARIRARNRRLALIYDVAVMETGDAIARRTSRGKNPVWLPSEGEGI
jgi:hypothetical protein